MKLGIDVESGELSYREFVEGAIESSKSFQTASFCLIGNKKKILTNYPSLESNSQFFVLNSPEVIGMDEKPVAALKSKKLATVISGVKLLKQGVVDAFFSPGNTGATIAASVLNLGMLGKIKKPAMAVFFPRADGSETLIIDIGANPEANEINIYQNALLGQIYYKMVWGREDISVGLLNMGSEVGKGSFSTKKAYNQLGRLNNFIGNVEGYDVFNGNVDVVVCNGFTGNSVLKIAEAMKFFFLNSLKEVYSTDIKKKNLFSYSFDMSGIHNEKRVLLEQKLLPKFYGAAPLLGVNGCVLVGHGKSGKKDLVNAVELANKLYLGHYLDKICSFIKENDKK